MPNVLTFSKQERDEQRDEYLILRNLLENVIIILCVYWRCDREPDGRDNASYKYSQEVVL
jgi:hypothetical protein